MLWPWRRLERVGHAAADDDGVGLLAQDLDDGQLVGDLGAADDGDERALRDSPSSARMVEVSRARFGPAALGTNVGGTMIEACARCDAPKASLT